MSRIRCTLKVILGVALAAFLTAVTAGELLAQSKDIKYPARPISIIVPYGAGGGPDINARLVAAYWKKKIGQPVAVVNKVGAAGALGYREIAHSAPDGYTLGCMAFPNSPVLVAVKGKDAGFRNEDLVAVANFTRTPDVLAVRKDGPFKTLPEFIAYAKKNPKKVSVSLAGQRQLLEVILIEQELGIDLNPVFFKSGGDAVNNLLGGHVMATVVVAQFAVTGVDKGIIPLALTGGARMAKLPNVPTFKELGYDVPVEMMTILCVPKGVPAPVVRKIGTTLAELGQDAEFVEKVNASGAAYGAMFPPELEKYYRATCASIGAIVAQSKSRFEE